MNNPSDKWLEFFVSFFFGYGIGSFLIDLINWVVN